MATGTIDAADEEVVLKVTDGSVRVAISNTFSGTLTLAVKDRDAADATYRDQRTYTAPTAPDDILEVFGATSVRLKATAWTSGTADVDLRARALPGGGNAGAAAGLPSGSATASNQTAQSTLLGAVNETAPASDTASSGLNGRLQRIAQRLTTILAALLDGTLFASRFPSGAVAAGIVPVTTTAAASSLVLKASAGNLYGLNIANGGTAGYALLYNATAAPSDGAVTPVKVYQLAANTSIEITYDPPLRMSTGAVVAYSSTGPYTQTLSATAHISGQCV